MKYKTFPVDKPNDGQPVYWYSYKCREIAGWFVDGKFIDVNNKWDGRHVKYWRENLNLEAYEKRLDVEPGISRAKRSKIRKNKIS